MPNIYPRDLVDVILEQPCRRVGNLVTVGNAKRPTASCCLQPLAELDVLESRKVGREMPYVHPASPEVLVESR